ncbi:MAG TPA: MGMT family protein [Saprospiraceae bacterium]|nr:MGMT family protein [Saprospiraceae bacterium]HMY84807.1 MGMT family protein [Saprospiraceae bacterium]HNA76149.1 MGMT family protein [Saprospiraceae bacterium]HNB61955.1 MGMT family protein [Saprospiraceae bacterium]HND73314.1 MGMT family protein [Saprospiraceae bacterium]
MTKIYRTLFDDPTYFCAMSSYFENVYALVRLIPRGRVTTFGAIANALGLGSARMVGWALNQLSGSDSSVPAHRVVNRKGMLSGQLHFDPGYSMAQRLIDEGVQVENDIVQDFKELFWDPALLAE